MTENEAIESLKRVRLFMLINDTVDNCGNRDKFLEEDYEANDIAVSTLKEIQQYRSIGTVEECQEAAEKHRAKKPINIRLLKTSGVHCGVCPICKNPVYADLKNQNHREYCGHCGQAIDWSDTP